MTGKAVFFFCAVLFCQAGRAQDLSLQNKHFIDTYIASRGNTKGALGALHEIENGLVQRVHNLETRMDDVEAVDREVQTIRSQQSSKLDQMMAKASQHKKSIYDSQEWRSVVESRLMSFCCLIQQNKWMRTKALNGQPGRFLGGPKRGGGP